MVIFAGFGGAEVSKTIPNDLYSYPNALSQIFLDMKN